MSTPREEFEAALQRYRIAWDQHAVYAFTGADVPEHWQEMANSQEAVLALYAAAIERAEKYKAEAHLLNKERDQAIERAEQAERELRRLIDERHREALQVAGHHIGECECEMCEMGNDISVLRARLDLAVAVAENHGLSAYRRAEELQENAGPMAVSMIDAEMYRRGAMGAANEIRKALTAHAPEERS